MTADMKLTTQYNKRTVLIEEGFLYLTVVTLNIWTGKPCSLVCQKMIKHGWIEEQWFTEQNKDLVVLKMVSEVPWWMSLRTWLSGFTEEQLQVHNEYFNSSTELMVSSSTIWRKHWRNVIWEYCVLAGLDKKSKDKSLECLKLLEVDSVLQIYER